MHILIWMIYAYPVAYSGSAEFKSLKSCEAAKAVIEQTYADDIKKYQGHLVKCVAK